MADSFRKRLVFGTPKHTRLEPAAPHPWRPDPKDSRTPIAPPDTASMHRRALDFIGQVRQVFGRQVGLKFEASKNAAQKVVGHISAISHRLADGLGLAQKGFGFRHFHVSIVGSPRVFSHS